MLEITYTSMVMAISCIWMLLRGFFSIKYKRIIWKRELQLILVYICLIVVARFTFFPFAKVDGEIQALIFDAANMFPVRINMIPFVNLLDYPETRSAMLNLIGNTTMFIPIGIIWPAVYKKLNTHKKVIVAGICFSLIIEILQLPFYDRVTDVDDLILNSLGFLIGYALFIFVRKLKHVIRQSVNTTSY